VGKRNIK